MQLGMEAALGAVHPRSPVSSGPAGRIFPHSVANVFLATMQTVGRNGRTIQDFDAAAHTLKVAYPLSFLSNNWGGILLIQLTPAGDGTRVTIAGDGHDANDRVQKLADAIFDDLSSALDTAHQ
jgi:hypothetical protein